MEPSSILEEIIEFSRFATHMCDIVTILSNCMDRIFEKLVAAVMEHSVGDENERVNMEKTHIHARMCPVRANVVEWGEVSFSGSAGFGGERGHHGRLCWTMTTAMQC